MGDRARYRDDGLGGPAEARAGVRWGLVGDEPGIAKLLELNGIPRWVAFEEKFIVAAASGGEILAALRYRTSSKRLLLGPLVVDPWARERTLARALYSGAIALAREMGVREIRADSHRDYPYEAGYYRWKGGWRLDTRRSPEVRAELPVGGWRRIAALMGVLAVPFFRIPRNKEETTSVLGETL